MVDRRYLAETQKSNMQLREETPSGFITNARRDGEEEVGGRRLLGLSSLLLQEEKEKEGK
jgi:hypothetical protein